MRNGKLLFVMLALTMLALFVISCSTGGESVNNITVVNFEANDSACTPKNVETQQGFLMKITFKNTGTTEAALNIPAVPFTLVAPAGQTVLGNFTAPTAPGKYDFTCGGASNPTKGELQVKSN